jgi:hypothetical protein
MLWSVLWKPYTFTNCLKISGVIGSFLTTQRPTDLIEPSLIVLARSDLQGTVTLPASDTSVSVYLIHLTNAGKSASTINEAFCVISWAHRLAGLADPSKSDLVKTIREGSIGSEGRRVVKKEPITPEIFVRVHRFTKTQRTKNIVRTVCRNLC